MLLFLDDDHERHHAFRACMQKHGYSDRFQIVQVFTSAAAIAHLRDHASSTEHVFLDHDLTHDDTGMKVVEYLETLPELPRHVTIHSVNPIAAPEMKRRLVALRTIVTRIPFPHLIERMQASVGAIKW